MEGFVSAVALKEAGLGCSRAGGRQKMTKERRERWLKPFPKDERGHSTKRERHVPRDKVSLTLGVPVGWRGWRRSAWHHALVQGLARL